MAAFDASLAITALNGARTGLGATDPERDAYLAEAKKRLEALRTPEDKREAVKLAVETGKMILTISIAMLVATGTFVQFARTSGLPWASLPIFAFGVAVVAQVISMWAGFYSISRIYKRAEGREQIGEPPWSTEPVTRPLNLQAWMGLIGLAALVVGLITWAMSAAAPQAAVSINIPGSPGTTAPAGPLLIEGAWTDLKLTTASKQELKLPATSQPIELMCK
ncbi:hypothetical protein ACD578_28680 (plasmid) [Microvirga sp. RSM25]|uniref:hypothetical protein n=1 Tax=Microvirga sp. RSM25 TaxID=3273802 RepID=UPI00384E115E